MSEYAGQQFVGIDLHRRRSVIVRTTGSGAVLESVRILNDVESLDRVIDERVAVVLVAGVDDLVPVALGGVRRVLRVPLPQRGHPAETRGGAAAGGVVDLEVGP